jgi:lysozyme
VNVVKRAVAVSAIGIAAIAGYEGLRTTAYLDPVGIPTICYGYTENVFLGMKKTKSECVVMLQEEVDRFTKDVLRISQVPLSQGELDAYVSFAYNVGSGNFQRSTLLQKLRAGDREGACKQLTRWVYAKGKQLPGLVARRAAEMKVCLEGVRESTY